MLPRLRRPKCQTPASLLKASRWAVVALGLVASGGTALSFSRKQHWFVRLFDFPRVQLAITGTIAGALFRRFFWRGTPGDPAFLYRESKRLNSRHANILYAVFCLKKKK